MSSPRLTESLALLRIALPLVAAYLADILTLVTAKAVIGKLGFRELAASGVAADLSFQIAIVVMGFFSVVGVLASGAFGARRREDVLPALFQGLWMALVAGAALLLFVRNIGPVLAVLGQDPGIVALSHDFSQSFAFALPPLIVFALLRSFAAALMRTGAVLAITFSQLLLTFLVMPGLVHGAFGLPALGLAGAGIGWAILAWFKCLCLAVVVWWLVRQAALPLPEDWVSRSLAVGHFLRLGLPVAGIVALESGLFASVSLMSGVLGPQPLAAYQIVMGWISVPFIISLGLAEGAMVRVAFWRGAGEAASARRAGHLGMAIGVAVPFLLIVVPLGMPSLVVKLFLSQDDAGYAALSVMVGRLLFIAAIFQVFDGLQAIASHALRGLHDAAVPLVIAGVGYWFIGLGSAWWLAFHAGMGVDGLWWGLALGLAFTGTMLALRFERLSSGIAARAIEAGEPAPR
jgi:MATE family multidrug resistance protein